MDILQHRPIGPHRYTSRRVTFTTVARRARRLKITTEELQQCRTFGDLQRRAKARFRALARDSHPDLAHSRVGQYTCKGYEFSRYQKTYAFFMRFDPQQSLPPPPNKVPMQEPPLPLSFFGSRGHDLGWGYQYASWGEVG